jgi:hypothetical protein
LHAHSTEIIISLHTDWASQINSSTGHFETTDQAIYVLGAIGVGAAEAVPSLCNFCSYQRVLGDLACPVGERSGYIFQSGAIDALVKIGTPEAMKAVEQYKMR